MKYINFNHKKSIRDTIHDIFNILYTQYFWNNEMDKYLNKNHFNNSNQVNMLHTLQVLPMYIQNSWQHNHNML